MDEVGSWSVYWLDVEIVRAVADIDATKDIINNADVPPMTGWEVDAIAGFDLIFGGHVLTLNQRHSIVNWGFSLKAVGIKKPAKAGFR